MKNDKYLQDLTSRYDYDPHRGVFYSSRTRKPITSKKDGYIIAQPKIQGSVKKIYLHRFALWLQGYDITNKDVDHINGVRDDNRLCNLRLVSRCTNMRNVVKRVDNTSGLAGVSWHKTKGKWEVRFLREFRGLYQDFFEACCRRKSLENKEGDFTGRHGK